LLFQEEDQRMTAHNSDPAQPAHFHYCADNQTGAAIEAQAPASESGTTQPVTQAERSVMHPEWHDPEWRYYHGAWGG
jgi:hypothetical protein